MLLLPACLSKKEDNSAFPHSGARFLQVFIFSAGAFGTWSLLTCVKHVWGWVADGRYGARKLRELSSQQNPVFSRPRCFRRSKRGKSDHFRTRRLANP